VACNIPSMSVESTYVYSFSKELSYHRWSPGPCMAIFAAVDGPARSSMVATDGHLDHLQCHRGSPLATDGPFQGKPSSVLWIFSPCIPRLIQGTYRAGYCRKSLAIYFIYPHVHYVDH